MVRKYERRSQGNLARRSAKLARMGGLIKAAAHTASAQPGCPVSACLESAQRWLERGCTGGGGRSIRHNSSLPFARGKQKTHEPPPSSSSSRAQQGGAELLLVVVAAEQTGTRCLPGYYGICLSVCLPTNHLLRLLHASSSPNRWQRQEIMDRGGDAVSFVTDTKPGEEDATGATTVVSPTTASGPTPGTAEGEEQPLMTPEAATSTTAWGGGGARPRPMLKGTLIGPFVVLDPSQQG